MYYGWWLSMIYAISVNDHTVRQSVNASFMIPAVPLIECRSVGIPLQHDFRSLLKAQVV